MDQPTLEGYPRLSALMGRDPALAVFRRYGSLCAQNLLYMQAEVNELHCELKEIANEDHYAEDEERKLYSKEWGRLARARGEDSLQWSKFLEVRAKLDEYCKTKSMDPRMFLQR